MVNFHCINDFFKNLLVKSLLNICPFKKEKLKVHCDSFFLSMNYQLNWTMSIGTFKEIIL